MAQLKATCARDGLKWRTVTNSVSSMVRGLNLVLWMFLWILSCESCPVNLVLDQDGCRMHLWKDMRRRYLASEQHAAISVMNPLLMRHHDQ